MLGILFEKQNVAFMVGLAFGVAAAANFPVLILSMYWKGLTTRGALFGGYGGLFSAVLFVLFSKSVWVDVLGNTAALFPYTQPALFAMPIAFLRGLRLLEARRQPAGARTRSTPSTTSTSAPRPASARRQGSGALNGTSGWQGRARKLGSALFHFRQGVAVAILAYSKVGL